MFKIAIIGKGNVGSHLNHYFRNIPEFIVNSVDSRTLQGLQGDEDLNIIAVSDHAIGEVAGRIVKRLPSYDKIVVHTSGSVSIKVLQPYFDNYGVFYPLQTFSKDVSQERYNEIPLFVEGSSPVLTEKLISIGRLAFDKVYELTSDVREKLHLAAVFSCNFVNAMYGAAETLLKDNEIPFSILHPLIMQTALKALDRSPRECQTGPAVRGNKDVMSHHMEFLKAQYPELSVLYSEISDYIIDSHQCDVNSEH